MPMRKRLRIAQRRTLEEPEIIVIPMIDVMMFLLFFFMVASLAMVTQAALPVSLPKSSTAQQENAETITLTVRATGEIYLNTTLTTIDKIQSGLTALHVGAKNLVTLNVDEHIPYGTVVSVMDEARKAGVTTFGFATKK